MLDLIILSFDHLRLKCRSEFYAKACVPVRKENIEATSDSSKFSYLLRDEQRVSLGEFVDGP